MDGLHRRLFLCPIAGNPGGKDTGMKLNIWYEGYKETVIELNAEETEGLWISLSLDGDEEMSQEERERKIQEAFDERFNKPDYNNWHKLRRHTGFSKSQYTEDREAAGADATDGDSTGEFSTVLFGIFWTFLLYSINHQKE